MQLLVVHEFDEVRIQNEYEYEYGERDALDCIYGAMGKYKIDSKGVYLTGHSQGGLVAFTLGLHHHDLCAAYARKHLKPIPAIQALSGGSLMCPLRG